MAIATTAPGASCLRNVPVPTVHGLRDRTVPYSQALELQAVLNRAGVANQLFTVANCDNSAMPSRVDQKVLVFARQFAAARAPNVNNHFIVHELIAN